jgi:hypothetical protein
MKKEVTEKNVYVNFWKTIRQSFEAKKTVDVLVSAVFSYK